MRPLTTAQEDVLHSAHFRVAAKLEIATSSGGFTDMSNLAGANWLLDASIDYDVDLPIAELRANLLREISTGISLSPLRADSTLNQNSTGGAISLLDVHREVKYSVATVPASCSAGSTDYELLFHGEIDEWNVAQSPMALKARDLAGGLQDRWVEDKTVYGSAGGTALHTVIQQILTTWSTGVTLFVPSTPTFLVLEYQQDQSPVLEAVRQLAGKIGYELRYMWSSASTSFRFTLYDPERGSTAAPASTFGSSRYAAVTQLAVDRTRIRNAVSVLYPLGTDYREELVQSTSSQERFGYRWLQIAEPLDSQIDSSSEANTYATAILTDLKDPKADQEIDMHLYWPVELGDAYRWSANGVHYSTDQDLAVTGYRHEIGLDRHRTMMRVRGVPSGGYLRWIGQRHVVPDPFGGFAFVTLNSTDDVMLHVGAADALVHGAFYRLSTTAYVEPTSGAGTFIARGQMPYSAALGHQLANTTDAAYLWLKFWNVARGFGEHIKQTLTRASTLKRAPVLSVASESESATTGTYGVVVYDPDGIATDLRYRTKQGDDAWSGWNIKASPPVHATSYTETVTLVEDHLSFIEFRLDYTLNGQAYYLHSKSSGFDKGRIPDFSMELVSDDDWNVSPQLNGDFDFASARITGTVGTAPAVPSSGTVASATIFAPSSTEGRNLYPSRIAATSSGWPKAVAAGEKIVVAALAYSSSAAGGNESSHMIVKELTRLNAAPALDEFSFSVHDSSSAAVDTFTVTWRVNTGTSTAMSLVFQGFGPATSNGRLGGTTTVTIGSAGTSGSTTFTSSFGDGESDTHRCVALLKSSGGATLDTKDGYELSTV